MTEKGIVVSIERNYAIVLDTDGAYRKIEKKPGLAVGREIYFSGEDLYTPVAKSPRFVLVAAAAAAAIMLFAGTALVFFQESPWSPEGVQPAAVVSVDINPSMEMTVDEQLNVLELQGLNEDAENLVDDRWQGQPLGEVLQAYLTAAAEKGYLSEESNVLMGYSLLDEMLGASQLEKALEDSLAGHKIPEVRALVVRVRPEIAEEARQKGLSIARYHVFSEKGNGPPENIDEISGTDVSELIQRGKNIRDLVRPQPEDLPGPPSDDRQAPGAENVPKEPENEKPPVVPDDVPIPEIDGLREKTTEEQDREKNINQPQP